LIRSHPFDDLISDEVEGRPFISPLPLHLVDEADQTLLLGHCAKPIHTVAIAGTLQSRLVDKRVGVIVPTIKNSRLLSLANRVLDIKFGS
jgi:hypothetical protein